MNEFADKYHEKSRPIFCAETGMVDELVRLKDLRRYLVTISFTGAYEDQSSAAIQLNFGHNKGHLKD